MGLDSGIQMNTGKNQLKNGGGGGSERKILKSLL